MRLIDADRFEAFCTGIPEWADADSFMRGIDEVIYEIDNAPTVDAVEVVRCRDCKFCENTRFFNTSAKVCRWWEKLTDEDGFCHAAKRIGEEDGEEM